MKHTKDDLMQLQVLPLDIKISLTKDRIRGWYEHYGGEVYVSFSGGKDSTVLLDICRQLYPDIEAVFIDTGLEYPEIRQFVKSFTNVTWIKPQMMFTEVISRYGYPVISKTVSHGVDIARRNPNGNVAINLFDSGKTGPFALAKWEDLRYVDFLVSDKCCNVMKKAPAHDFQKRTGKKPIIATMATESKNRETQWYKHGCNSFDSKTPKSQPMSFWTEQDVLLYIKQNNLPIASVYGNVIWCDNTGQISFDGIGRLKTTGCRRTGCIFCAYGAHLEKEHRFVSLSHTHTRQYEFCIGGGGFDENGIWRPTKEGLGMGYVFDKLNELYGDNFIKYKK